MKRIRFATIGAVAAAIVPGVARAECEGLRPTDPDGYFAGQFAAFGPATYDSPGGRARIHHATSGPAAPDPTTTPPNVAPDFVVTAGLIADEALALFEAWGFSEIRSDAGPGGCASNGGDGRIDIYLVDFNGGDGQAVTEECEAGESSSCSGYVLVEAWPSGYPSDEIALRTIVPHELFHLVQKTYTGAVPPWFAEGTAQWAADRAHPALTDLEKLVPYYVEEAHRSIDNPPGGAAAGFLYGTAVWPVYLDETIGDGTVRAVLERMGDGMDVWEATDAALAPGESAASMFPAFAAALAGSGDRALSGGFIDAAKYQAVEATPVAPTLPGPVVEDVLSGFAIRVLEVGDLGGLFELSLAAPDGRVAATVVPLEGAGARVDLAALLPATTRGPALLVVAGTSPSKMDAPFRIEAASAPQPVEEGGGGAGGAPSAEPSSSEPEDDGCSASRGPAPSRGAGSIPSFLLSACAFIASNRTKRRRGQ